MSKAKILEALQKSRNPHDIAENLGVKVSDVRLVMRNHELEELQGWGKPHLQEWIVSRRRAWEPSWPSRHNSRLTDHKRMHDQGSTTMCQGRDGDYIIQYSILSQRPIKRAAYFFGG